MPTQLVLLGAGASAAAGVPTTRAMSQRIVAAISADPRAARGRLSQALNFVHAQMVAHAARYGAGAFDDVDVEHLFSAIDLLASRRSHEATPFVSAWHPAVEEMDRRGMPSFFESDFNDAVMGSGRRRPSELIKEAIEALTGPGDGRTYARLLDRMILELRRLVHVPDAGQAAHLRPLLDLSARQGLLTIATLNYDRSVELLAAADGVEVDTGIETWTSKARWRWRPTGVRLLKLHGSIDWCLDTERPDPGLLPSKRIRVTSDPLGEKAPPAIIFGLRGKLRADGPFLDLLARFRDDLRQANELVVVGYSFRDDHVNEAIREWLNQGPARRLTVVDPGYPEAWHGREPEFRVLLNQALTPRQPHEHFAPRLTVVREPAEVALSRVLGP